MIRWMKQHPPPMLVVMFAWGLVFGYFTPGIGAWLHGLLRAAN